MFEGFKHVQLQTSDPQVTINLRYGGTGPGLLLLHGNLLTHVAWHKIAPRLSGASAKFMRLLAVAQYRGDGGVDGVGAGPR
jgi:hypothetical protein